MAADPVVLEGFPGDFEVNTVAPKSFFDLQNPGRVLQESLGEFRSL